MTTAIAPGKIILIGEHAVVYGRPAIAAPVWGLQATATILDAPPGTGCLISAPDVDLHFSLAEVGDEQPLALVLRLALRRIGMTHIPDWQVELHSELPIAGGLGSGAALSAALVRAIFAHTRQTIDVNTVSELVFESERFYHGTPSGIDNSVIAHGMPIWFVKGKTPVAFLPRASLHFVIADSGVRSPTKETVGDVRKGWQQSPAQYESWFDAIAQIAHQARQSIEQGQGDELGALFTQNHALLQQIGVSSPLLDRLVQAALDVGAEGAKLSGGGRGGNVIALIKPKQRQAVEQAFLQAGAKRVLSTKIDAWSW